MRDAVAIGAIVAAVLAALLAAVLALLVAPATVLAQAADPLDPAGAPAPVRRAVFRAETARSQGDLEAARRLLVEALADGADRDHPSLRYRLGAYLIELERPAEALPHLRRAAEQAPRVETIWRDLGRAAYETGNHAESAAAFGRAHRLAQALHTDPAHAGHAHAAPDPLLLYYSGVAWILADRPDSALTALVPLMTAAPDTVPQDWVRALVSAAAAAEKPQRAAAGVERLLRDHLDRPGAWRLASQQAQLQGDLPLAAARLQVADWLVPLPPDELTHLAELQAAAGAPRRAARAYARAMAAGRRDATLAARFVEPLVEPLAVAWLQAHEPDSARVVLRAELSERPRLRLWMLLGDLEYGIQRWEQAVAAYTEAARLDPAHGRAWLMLGACEVRRDRRAEAIEHLERAAADGATATQARSLLRQLAAAER